jgi:hypothetical protein
MSDLAMVIHTILTLCYFFTRFAQNIMDGLISLVLSRVVTTRWARLAQGCNFGSREMMEDME